MSIALLTSMLPRDIQDMVFQQGRIGEALRYRDVRDKVMGIASNRSHELIPTPMDVSCLEEATAGSEAACGDRGGLEIDAIRGQCYNCQGWGHSAAECPSQPATGKGKSTGDFSKGGGKAIGKGGS